MCGIVGIVSNKSVSSSIINALKKLEYRGYDSAGISTLNNGFIDEKKCSSFFIFTSWLGRQNDAMFSSSTSAVKIFVYNGAAPAKNISTSN